jgi:hypothetical protein
VAHNRQEEALGLVGSFRHLARVQSHFNFFALRNIAQGEQTACITTAMIV